MEPAWEIWRDGCLELFYLDPGWGVPKGILVGTFETALGWGNQTDFWLGSVKVRRSGGQMKMWSGDPKEDVTRSNRQVRDC